MQGSNRSSHLPSGRILMMMMCIIAAVPHVQSLANNNNKKGSSSNNNNNRNTCPANHLLDMLGNNSNNNNNKEALGLYGVHDALSARILEAQLPDNQDAALFVSGFGISASRLGQPDAGLLTCTELQDSAKAIVQRTHRMPVLVDGDTGFGGAPNLCRTIRDVASLKAAAITIEDQIFPKRCTYVAGKGITVLDRNAAKERMQVALAAQQEAYEQDGNQILLVARTDCRRQLGLEEAVERCLIFEALGADIVYAENLQSPDEYLTLRSKMQECTPMILAQVQTGDPDQTLWNLQQISEMGYNMGLFGVSGLQATVSALEQVASEMMQCGGIAQTTPLASLDKLKSVVGFDELDAFQERATSAVGATMVDDKRIRSSTTALSSHAQSGGGGGSRLFSLSSRLSNSRLGHRFNTALRNAASDITEPDDEQGPQAPIKRTPPAEIKKNDEPVAETEAETKPVDAPPDDKVKDEQITLPDDTISNLLNPLVDSDLNKEIGSTYDPLKAKFPSAKTSTNASPFAKKGGGGGSPFAKNGMSSFPAATAKKGMSSFPPATAKKGMSSFPAATAKKGMMSSFPAATAKKGMPSFPAASAKKGMSSFPAGKQSTNPFFAKKGGPKGMNNSGTSNEMKDQDEDEEGKAGSKAPAKSSFVPKDIAASTSPFAAKKGSISSFTPPPKGTSSFTPPKGASSFTPPKQSGNPFFATKGGPKGFVAKTTTTSDEIKEVSSDNDKDDKSEETTLSTKSPFATKAFPKKPAASVSVSPFSKEGGVSPPISPPSMKGMASSAKKGFSAGPPIPGKAASVTPFASMKASPKGMSKDSSDDEIKEEPSDDAAASKSPFAKKGMTSFSAAKNGLSSFSEVAKKRMASFSAAAQKSMSSFTAPTNQSGSPFTGAKGSPKVASKECDEDIKEISSNENSVDSKAPPKSSFAPKPIEPNGSTSASPFAKKGIDSFSTAAKKGMASFTAPKQSTSPFSGMKGGPKGMTKDAGDELKEDSKDDDSVGSKAPAKNSFAPKTIEPNDSTSASPFAKKGMVSFTASAKNGRASFTAPKQSTSPFSGMKGGPKGITKDAGDELKEDSKDDDSVGSKAPSKSPFAPKTIEPKDSASASPFAKKGINSFSTAAKKGMASFTAPKQSTSPFSGVKGGPKGMTKDAGDELKEDSKDDDSVGSKAPSKSPFAPKTIEPNDSTSASPFAKKGIDSFSTAAKKGMASFTAPKQSTSPFSGMKGGPKGMTKDADDEVKEDSKDDDSVGSEAPAKNSFAPKTIEPKDSASASPFAKKGIDSFSTAAKKGMASFTAPKQSASPFSDMTGSPKGLSNDTGSEKKSPKTFPKSSDSTSALPPPGKQTGSPFGMRGSPKGMDKDSNDRIAFVGEATAGEITPEATEKESGEKKAAEDIAKEAAELKAKEQAEAANLAAEKKAAVVAEATRLAAEKETAELKANEEAKAAELAAFIADNKKAIDEAKAANLAAEKEAKEQAEEARLAAEKKYTDFAEAARIKAEKEAAVLKAKEQAEAARRARLEAEKETAELKANEEAKATELAAFIAEKNKAAEEAEAAKLVAEKEAAELKAKKQVAAASLAAEKKATEEAEAARIAENEVAKLMAKEQAEAENEATEEAEIARIKEEQETAKRRRKAVKIKIVELDEEEDSEDDFEIEDQDLLAQIQEAQAALENYSERLDAVLDEEDTINKGAVSDLDASEQPVQVEVIPTDSRSGDRVEDKNSPAYSPDGWFSKYGGKTLDQLSPQDESIGGDGSGAVVGQNIFDDGDGLRAIPEASESWFEEKNYRKNRAFGMEKTSFGMDQVKKNIGSGDQGRLLPLQEGSSWYADPKQGLASSRQETSQPQNSEPDIVDAMLIENESEGYVGDSEPIDEEGRRNKVDPALLQPKASWFDNSGVKGPYMKPSSETSTKPQVDETVLRPVDITNSWYSESKGRSKGAYGETPPVQKVADKQPNEMDDKQSKVKEDAPSQIDPTLLQPRTSWFDNSNKKGPYMEPSGSRMKPEVDETVLRPVDNTNSWYDESKGRSKGAYIESPPSSSKGKTPDVDDSVLKPVDIADSWYDESKGRSKGAYATSDTPPNDSRNTKTSDEPRLESLDQAPLPDAPIKTSPDDDGDSFHHEEPASPSLNPLQPFEQQPRWFDESSLRKSKKESQPTNSIPDQPAAGQSSVLQPLQDAGRWFDTRKPTWGTPSEPSAEKLQPKADDSVLIPVDNTQSWYDESKYRDGMIGGATRPRNPEAPAEKTSTDAPSDDQKEETNLEQEAELESFKAKQEILENERVELVRLKQAEQDRLEQLLAIKEAKDRAEEEARQNAGLYAERESVKMERELLVKQRVDFTRAKRAEQEARLRAAEEAKRNADLEAERESVKMQQELLEKEKEELAHMKRIEEGRLRAAEKSRLNAALDAERESIKMQKELLEKEKADVARAKQVEEDRLRAAEEAKRNAALEIERERLKVAQELLEKGKADLARVKQVEDDRLRAAEAAKRYADLEAERERLKVAQKLLETEKAEFLLEQERAKLATPDQDDEAPAAAASEPESSMPPAEDDSTTQATDFSPMDDVGTIGPDSNWRDAHQTKRMNDLGDTMNGENW